MRLFLMIYDATVDDEILEALDALGIQGYTKWNRVLGKGPRSDPKMDTSVWPGFNCALALAVEDEHEPTVREALRRLSDDRNGEGIKIYAFPVEEIG